MHGEFNPRACPESQKPLLVKWQAWLLVAGTGAPFIFGRHPLFDVLGFTSVVLAPFILARETRESITLRLVKRG
jgi:hypothetical protein